MRAVLRVFTFALLMVAGACASRPRVIESGVAPIALDRVQVAQLDGDEKVSFPAGMYLPDFKTDEGTYYRSPSKLLHSTPKQGNNAPMTGGLFVPFPGRPDQRQGAWFENRDNSWFGSPEKVWRFQQNIEFRSVAMGR